MMPVNFMENNLVFDTYGNAYALFVINSSNYAFLPDNKKITEIRKVEAAISSYFGEYYIYLLTKQLSLRQIKKEMQGFSGTSEWARQTELSLQILKEQLPFVRQNFIAVPLKKRVYHFEDESIKKILIEYLKYACLGIQDVGKKFTGIVNLKNEIVTIGYDVLQSCREQSDLLSRDTLGNFRDLRPANIYEVEWWLKKGYFRGLSDPQSSLPVPFPAQVITQSGKTVIRPIRNTVISLSDSLIREKFYYLRVHHDDEETSYQTFYTSLAIPNNIDDRYPLGKEWIYGLLETLNFPVDAAFHVRCEPHTEARDKVGRKNKIAKSQVREWEHGEEEDAYAFGQSNVQEELLEDIRNVPSLQRKFREKEQPLFYATCVYGFGAQSFEQLRKYQKEFVSRAGKCGHTLAHPPLEMKRMFQAFYPFGQNLPQNWEIPMDPGVFASGVPFGVRMLGDPTGFILGKLFTGRFVFMNPRRPMTELQKTGAILISGDLGSGKSALMKLINFMMLQWGAYGFANDPKGDWRKFCEHPVVRPLSRIISFTPGSDTLFTPFRLAPSKAECFEAALGILELIFNKDNTEKRSAAISEVLDRLYTEQHWDMFSFERIVNDLVESHPNPKLRDELEMVQTIMRTLPNHGVGRMIYGRDDGSDMFGDKRFVCAITRGLTLPKRGTKLQEWNANERLAVAMMTAIITLVLRYLMTLPNNILKTLTWEEFWYLNEFDRGRQLYQEALRLSRSEQTVVIMASQNPTDIDTTAKSEADDDVTGLFAWKFMLRLSSRKQVRYAVENLLEMPGEDIDFWAERFEKDYGDGRGLVKDAEGRIGELKIEIFDDLLKQYIYSTPGTIKSEGHVLGEIDDEAS